MGFFSGVASGIAKGSTAKIKGEQDRATQDELVKERERRKEMFGLNKQKAEISTDALQQQLESIKAQNAKILQDKNKADAYKFIDSYNNRTDPTDTSALNNLIQHNAASGKALGKIYDDEKGAPVVRIQPLSVADNHILPNEMKNGSIDINPNRMVKGITADGREIFIDLAEYNTINGFQKQLDKDGQVKMDRLYEIKKRNLELDKLQGEVNAANGDGEPLSKEGKMAHDYGLRFGPKGSPEYNKASAEVWNEKLYSGDEQIRAEQKPLMQKAIDTVFSQDANVKLPTGKELTETLADAKRLKLFKDKDITKDKVLSGINVVHEANKLSKEIHSLKDEELSKGIQDQGIKAISSYFSDTDFKKLPTAEQEKILKSIKFESKIGNLVSQYIKSISGTAVAEAEYQRLSNLFGTDKLKNIDTMKSALSGWIGSMNTEVNLNIENSKTQNPFDYMYYKNEMDKAVPKKKSLDEIFGSK
jgi:hypothetical protein